MTGRRRSPSCTRRPTSLLRSLRKFAAQARIRREYARLKSLRIGSSGSALCAEQREGDDGFTRADGPLQLAIQRGLQLLTLKRHLGGGNLLRGRRQLGHLG